MKTYGKNWKKDQPSLNYAQEVSELKAKGPGPLYLLWGEEDYLLKCFLDELRSACLQGGDESFDYKKLSGPEQVYDDVAEAVNAMPFMGGRIFVEMAGFDVNRCKDERTQALFEDIPEWCTVAIVQATDAAPDGRLSFVKNLKKRGKAMEFKSQDSDELIKWMRRRFRALGKEKVDQSAMERLMQLSGDRMSGLIPEIEKVAAYAAGERVTVADVDAVAHHLPEADAFEMAECIATKDYDGAADKLSELLAGGEEPIKILSTIAWQMRQLYVAEVCEETGQLAQLGELLNSRSDYRIRKTQELAKRFPKGVLARYVRLCAECVLWTREAGSVTDETEALRELLVRFAVERKYA